MSTSGDSDGGGVNGFEVRNPSVRGLPHGQFHKYRQMFDTMMKRSDKSSNKSATDEKKKKQSTLSNKTSQVNSTREEEETEPRSTKLEKHIASLHFVNSSTQTSMPIEEKFIQKETNLIEDDDIKNLLKNFPYRRDLKILELPFTDDEKSSQILKQSSLFDGVSDETSSLLDNLCNNNKLIAEFLCKEDGKNVSKSSGANYETSQREIDKLDDDNDSGIKVDRSKAKSCFSSSKLNEELSEASKSSLEFLDSINGSLNRTNEDSRGFASSSFVIPEISCLDEFNSDESFNENDDENLNNLSYSVHGNSSSEALDVKIKPLPPLPPPKPARTFQHDVCVESKKLADFDSLAPFKLRGNFDESANKPRTDNNKHFNNLKAQSVNFNKLAVSEPNLRQIGNKKNKNEKNFRPFNKFITNLKKTLSRKSLSGEDGQHESIKEEDVESEYSSDDFEVVSSLNLSQSQDTCLNDLKNLNNYNKKSEIDFKRARDRPKLSVKSHIYTSVAETNKNTLFDYALIVGLKKETRTKFFSTEKLNTKKFLNTRIVKPVNLWQFPEEIPNLNPNIVEFCFPDAQNQIDVKKNKNEIFQFILTNFDGSRIYGYCIRLYEKNNNPIVVCFVSSIDAVEIYHTLLTETERLYAASLNDVKLFLTAIYSKPFPERGESIVFTIGIKQKRELVLNRSYDRRLEYINLDIILNYQFDLIASVFQSMLAEKRIIFISEKLSVLSNTIQAFETLLYPFSWPYMSIPVLPRCLIGYCCVLSPVMVGVLRSCKKELMQVKNESEADCMLIIDLDKNKIIHEVKSVNDLLLPEFLLRELKHDFNALLQSCKLKEGYQKNVDLYQIFLKIFVKTIGHYKNFIVPDNLHSLPNQSFRFLLNEFVESPENKEIRTFLKWFCKTPMFDTFICKKLNPTQRFAQMFDETVNQMNNKVENVQQKGFTFITNLAQSKLNDTKELKSKEKIRNERF